MQSNTKFEKFDISVREDHTLAVTVKGKKENPFTYEHEYAVQEVIDEIVGGVRFYGKNID